jgi:hypothetical protein
MTMGSGMGDMAEMGMPCRRTASPWRAEKAPSTRSTMAACSPLLKVRAELPESGDPGWYEHPAGTSRPWRARRTWRRDGVEVDTGHASPGPRPTITVAKALLHTHCLRVTLGRMDSKAHASSHSSPLSTTLLACVALPRGCGVVSEYLRPVSGYGVDYMGGGKARRVCLCRRHGHSPPRVHVHAANGRAYAATFSGAPLSSSCDVCAGPGQALLCASGEGARGRAQL